MTESLMRGFRHLVDRLPRRPPPIVAGAVVLVVVLLAGVGTAIAWAAGLPEGVALRVGDRFVTEQQFEKRTNTLRALYGIEPPSEEAELDRFRRDVAKSIAASIVLDRAARDRGIVTSDKSARDMLATFIEQRFPTGGHAAFVQALGTFGASERDVLDEIKLQSATGVLYERVTAGVEVSEDDVRAAYEERAAELVRPEQRRLYNIVVPTRAEADQVAEQARTGTDFTTLVRRHSLDGSTRDAGGDLGLVTADILEKPYADAAFAAAPGEVFGPVQTRNGWNVGKATEVVAAAPLSFEESRDQLRQVLTTEAAARIWRPWVEEQIRSADVEYAARYQPADPGAAPTAPGVPAPDGLPEAIPAGGSMLLSVLALALLGLGHWGYLRVQQRSRAGSLLPLHSAPDERTYHRSAAVCQIVAGILVFATLTSAMPT